MSPSVAVADGRPTSEHLTRFIRQAGHSDRAERDAAFDQLYRYVAGPMKNLLARCVGRRPGRPVAVTEAINDAVASLFVKWKDLEMNDTGHFRALVVQTVYWKASAERRANRRLFEAVTDRVPAPTADVETLALDRFEEAVEELAAFERRQDPTPRHDRHRPAPLADVVKARHLVGLERVAGDEGPPAVPTFEVIGQMLGIDTATANKRYWHALEWLHANFPDVVPELPERKRAGRKKGNKGNGGAA
ncbi:MAG: sigma-70 family RNA polymerase sigma factor [Planctomycetes bacterium]|nr:sigma-70 family RNA polymerase sigma factor [Planctomycetota bacterium]